MGWCDSHEASDFERSKSEVVRFLERRLGSDSGSRDCHKALASEISSKFGVVLTPCEVKDIHRSGWLT